MLHFQSSGASKRMHARLLYNMKASERGASHRSLHGVANTWHFSPNGNSAAKKIYHVLCFSIFDSSCTTHVVAHDQRLRRRHGLIIMNAESIKIFRSPNWNLHLLFLWWFLSNLYDVVLLGHLARWITSIVLSYVWSKECSCFIDRDLLRGLLGAMSSLDQALDFLIGLFLHLLHWTHWYIVFAQFRNIVQYRKAVWAALLYLCMSKTGCWYGSAAKVW